MIRDKDILNNQLLEEIKMLKMENIKNMGYIEENKRLHHRLGETIAKNQQLQ